MFSEVKKECLRWQSAMLESIPGTIGELLRTKFYGYRDGFGVRILTGVIIHYPVKLNIGDNSGISSGTQINAAAEISIEKGSIVAAGAVVTKPLPPGIIAAWVPARVIARRDGLAPLQL